MCLSTIYSETEKKAILAKKPKRFVVWKAICKSKSRFWPPFYGHFGSYSAGVNISESGPGYYSFLHRKDAKEWGGPQIKICRCVVKKKTIKRIGLQVFRRGDALNNTIHAEVAVSSSIIMPKYIGCEKC